MKSDDLATIAVPLDFLGVNYYHRRVTAADDAEPLLLCEVDMPGEKTAMGWEVRPESLFDVLTTVTRDYCPPALYVTENGAAYDDVVEPDGRVHDDRRLRYLRDHLTSAQRAIAEGVPLLGYFVWSLLDNFQWAQGYSKRFGIVHVDFETQRRTVKDSGWFLSEVARRNAIEVTAVDGS